MSVEGFRGGFLEKTLSHPHIDDPKIVHVRVASFSAGSPLRNLSSVLHVLYDLCSMLLIAFEKKNLNY